jgi:hypothetical protein
MVLLYWMLLISESGFCDGAGGGATIRLRSELEDLQILRTRLLIDLPTVQAPSWRLMYLEKRESTNPVLQPEQRSLGVSGPLIRVGPVALEGILAQLYNPLAHDPGSDVFSETAGLALDIGMDMTSRRGVQLALVPRYWSVFATSKEAGQPQLGTGVVVPFAGQSIGELVALLCAPLQQGGDDADDPWYMDEPLYPGGSLTHLSGSFTCNRPPLNFRMTTAISAGQRVIPSTLSTLHVNWKGSPNDISLLLGHCGPSYFNPEGEGSDLQWLASLRASRDLGPLSLHGSYRREIAPPSMLPTELRESMDRFGAGVQIKKRIDPRCILRTECDAQMQLRRLSEGAVEEELGLDAEGWLDWRHWRVTAGTQLKGGYDSEQLCHTYLAIAHTPPWGTAELRVKYHFSPEPDLDMYGDVEVKGRDKRIYLRLECKIPLSNPNAEKAHLLELFSFCLGWETQTFRSTSAGALPFRNRSSTRIHR